MRPGKVVKAPADATVAAITYVPNIELLGLVWRQGDVLVYEANGFAMNELSVILRLWSERWRMKLDSHEFFERLWLGDGWRWVIEEVRPPRREAP